MLTLLSARLAQSVAESAAEGLAAARRTVVTAAAIVAAATEEKQDNYDDDETPPSAETAIVASATASSESHDHSPFSAGWLPCHLGCWCVKVFNSCIV